MGQLTVVRWRKFGQDRLYVADANGERFGWVDLVGQIEHLNRPDAEADFRTAVTDYCREEGLRVPGPRRPADLGSLPSGTPSYFPMPTKPLDQAVHPPATARTALVTDPVRHRLERLARSSRRQVLLRRVPAPWHVLHGVPIGDGASRLDHLLIGPGGVRAVTVARHPGARIWVGRNGLSVDGHQEQHLADARYQAEQAGELLSAACRFPVVVRPALVLLGHPDGRLDLTVEERPDGVELLVRADVPAAFERGRPRLSEVGVELIHDQARLATTWPAPR